VADENDTPTSDSAKDKCSHRISGCKLRFGAGNPLPFNGFPNAGQYA
jgi:lambda family phage minor tail protein L